MGYNNWAQFMCNIDEQLIRDQADAIVEKGLQKAGYDTVTVDECWMQKDRYASCDIQSLLEVVVADDAERWLDSLDPSAIATPDADASYLRRIGAAVSATASSQAELAASVAAAREHGHTWTQIATMLGTSRQAARERYGEPANRP